MKPLVPLLSLLLVMCGGGAPPMFDRTSDGSPEAEVRVANIAWRVDRDFDAARARLSRLDTYDAHLELARIALEQRRFDEALAQVASADRVAATKADRRRVVIARARVLLETRTRLGEVIASVREVIAAEGPRLTTTRMLARAGVLTRDRAAMMEGIDGYYHVSPYSAPPHLIAGAYAELAKAQDDAALSRALAGIRFFDEAALLAPQSDVARYAAMLKRIENLANEHYRQIALGHDSRGALRKGIARELKTIWPKLSFDDALDAMRRQYGGHLVLGKTAGFHDTHFGHKVIDREFSIEQYGRRGTVRFIVLDSMVSNGFQTWRTDGRSGDGGWGTAEEIYQIRPMYADGPLANWQQITDPEQHAKYVKKSEARTMDGLSRRLHLQYLTRVLAETKTREAFLSRVEREELDYSVVLHEGRHAIDAASGEKFDAWELEYRAKLSQVALSETAARDSLSSIVGDTIGGDSPHGKANEKIVTELGKRFDVHELDKLSDAQIREAFRALDPWAR
ncbi:MAG TPA: hypothetical protein VF911_17140 [Thermoanaerobaculia bacterium]